MSKNTEDARTSTEGSSFVEVTNPKHAVDLATKQSYSENVFLFLPNIIGYMRVVLAAMALYYMSYHPKYCTVAYALSQLLDAADGYAARALGQTSRFGAVLDMVVDRCTTSGLLVFLATAYPKWALFFQFLISLDFASHYMHMYSSLLTGSKSHKNIQSDVSRILRFYYTNKNVLFAVCAGNEAFYLGLYLQKWVRGPLFLLPGLEWAGPWTWANLLTWVSCPIFIYKNVVNFVQLWKASKILVGVDLADRAKERATAEKKT
ncbi:phosphatidylinositol synthase [Punctularia strigosozonata HHB-11173 SS5]|uniref:phosphatidylinositol synthase n=1 Tax=Punctularia strigosozonata (strain HHB-11173) TaxID=741275 RepID=UPI0004417A52|nr:phosphatidylinositol synthase [Punctularia strigosozonata HHB-11173 SS5]EIN07487.1 phosphatidylinositol synthase [Punctularia strigosozonata HHB-11173 SS5]